MRSVSVRARRGVAVLILLVAVTAVPAFADDPPPVPEDPQGRIAPPVGLVSEEPVPEDPQGRILPPVGVAAEEPPGVWELFLIWLQGRIHIPVG